jgi:hypothetical protein
MCRGSSLFDIDPGAAAAAAAAAASFGSSRVASGALGAEWNEAFELDLTPADSSVTLTVYDGKTGGGGVGGGSPWLGVVYLPIKEIMFSGGCGSHCEKWLGARGATQLPVLQAFKA